MSDPFLGELRLFSFGFPPKGWMFCNGQILSIQQNAALFSLLGTTYGGNGQSTFQLPNLQSRVPMHFGTDANSGISYVQGQVGGEETITLTLNQLPAHSHTFLGTSAGANDKRPKTGAAFATAAANNYYGAPSSLTALAATTVGLTGTSHPHTNIQPYLVLNWCIALQGIFPSRN